MEEVDFDLFDAEEFYIKHNDIHRVVWKILNGIPGNWEFSQYNAFTYDGLECHNVIFNDLNDEDRSFSIEWDNNDNPFPHKAHIEVATD